MNKELLSIASRPLNYVHKIPILKTRIFWEGLRNGEIFATKCKKCGKWYFPPQTDCPTCMSSDVEWISLSRTVTLEAFTQMHAIPQGFSQYEPYTIAIGSEAKGVKIIGWLEGLPIEEAKIGMKLKMSVKTLPDGYLVIMFEPEKSMESRAASREV